MNSPDPSLPQPSAPAPERVRGMFGAIAPTYDLLNRLLSGGLDGGWRARAARETVRGLSPCARLLDVATGTGDLARALERAARREPARRASTLRASDPASAPKPSVVGVDFTAPMLRRAREKFPAGPFLWTQADALALPFADGAFDAATIAFGLRNMADRPAALREMARVVRSGGRLAILEFSQPRSPALRRLYDFYSFRVVPRVGRWVSGSDAYRYLVRSIREFWDADELTRRMREAGLTNVRASALLGGVVYLHVGVKES